VVAENNVNLSEYFWIKGLSIGLPKNIFLREIMGLIFLGVYMVIIPVVVTKKWGQDLLARMGAARYWLLVFLVLGMMSLPLKMYLRWFFTLKYIVAMPEFELNL
jgi:hypothetical protein